MDTRNPTLEEFGEFRILNEIVLPKVRSVGPPKVLGDDCAFVPATLDASEELVITTDVGPKPLSWAVGLESYWSWGWYSVVVNLSDLASAGARGIAFSNSVDAPPDMEVPALSEFFDGIKDACNEFGVLSAGGNIRSASKFSCHGMAIGAVTSAMKIGRDGCRPGDVIVAIGECGEFMSSFLRVRATTLEGASEADKLRLLRPKPRLREMRILGMAGVISAATDNSDGILGSLWNIAERSGCSFTLDIEERDIPPAVVAMAREWGVGVMNLMLCWGDWQIVATVRRHEFERFTRIAAQERVVYTVLGTSIEGPPGLYQDGGKRRMRVIRNENFTANSFNAGLDAHLDYMLRSNLFEN